MPNSNLVKKLRAIISFANKESNEYEKLKLSEGGTIFGREQADIILNDHEVSSTHCQIQKVKDVYLIFDMNSSNGTLVNGERILKQELKSGDLVQLGKTKMTFTLEPQDQVHDIPTLSTLGKETYSEHEKTSIVDTLIENEIKNTQKWEMLLKVRYHDGKREEYRLQQNPVNIGRATSFGRFEQDVGISRKHLLIKLNDSGDIFVEDEGSTNGSYLNGKKIQGIHQVFPDDIVRLGSCELEIRCLSR